MANTKTNLAWLDADTGQELANPATKAAIEGMLKQLLIVLVNRLGGEIVVPVQEIDATDGFLLTMKLVDNRTAFRFSIARKS